MAKAELKTKENEESVEDFISRIEAESIRQDCSKIIEMMQKATNSEPKMWGASIVGFGTQHLKYESGHELDWMKIGFSPRKQNLTLYLSLGKDWDENQMSKLGKYKTGKGCLYIKRLSEIDLEILEEMINKSGK